MKSVNKIQDALINLRDLHDSQMEAILLRSCLSLPKIAFALRTCAPDLIRPALETFDDTIREALSDQAGCPLPDWSWLKASLPSSLGGLNLRRAALHAPAAYISSLHQSEPLISDILGHSPSPPALLPSCVRALGMAASMPDWSSPQRIDVPLRQRTLSRLIDEASFDVLIESSPGVRSKALALSSALPHAGDWLNVVPSSALGLHLLDQEFRPCLQYWLGLPIFVEGVRCPVCRSVADPFGDHHVGCGGNGDRIHRHNSIRDAIFSAAQTATLAPRKKLLYIFCALLPMSPCWHLPPRSSSRVWRLRYFHSATAYLEWCSQCPRARIESRRGEEDGPSCCLLPGCGSVVHPSLGPVCRRLERSRCQNPLQYSSVPRTAAGHTTLGNHPSPLPTVRYLPLERKYNSVASPLPNASPARWQYYLAFLSFSFVFCCCFFIIYFLAFDVFCVFVLLVFCIVYCFWKKKKILERWAERYLLYAFSLSVVVHQAAILARQRSIGLANHAACVSVAS